MLRRRHRRRGGILLEFALSVPFSLFLVLITIDVGRLILVNTALQDAVAVSARAGARQGYIGENAGLGADDPCASFIPGSAGTGNPSFDAFCESARRIPGAEITAFSLESPSTVDMSRGGLVCSRTGSGENIYVTVSAEAHINLITPGLGFLLDTPNDASGLPSTVSARSTARCEVAR